MLATFPKKYLDNKNMRPMYFTHPNIKDQTIMYGFGLNALPEESSTDYYEIFDRMGKIADSHVGILKKFTGFTKGVWNKAR